MRNCPLKKTKLEFCVTLFHRILEMEIVLRLLSLSISPEKRIQFEVSVLKQIMFSMMRVSTDVELDNNDESISTLVTSLSSLIVRMVQVESERVFVEMTFVVGFFVRVGQLPTAETK